jgi:hypothetical protein
MAFGDQEKAERQKTLAKTYKKGVHVDLRPIIFEDGYHENTFHRVR